MTRIILLLIAGIILNSEPATNNIGYRDFTIGDRKDDVLNILSKNKYKNYIIYYDNNDRYLGGIKIKSENSIKLSARRYMEKEDIILVFNNNNILFDIYSRIRPMDIRDYSDYKTYYTELYGNPASETVAGRNILAWSLNKKRHAVYMIYDHSDKSIILNIRDTYLNMKYTPE